MAEINEFANEHFGDLNEHQILAQRNPAFLADTCVWNKDYYIMYNMYGEIESCNKHNVKDGDFLQRKPRVALHPDLVRAATELERLAFIQKVWETFKVQIDE